MRVLITHPGMQHSHQLAWALEEAGLLAGFWSGVPVTDSGHTPLDTWARLRPSIRRIPVPSAKRSHLVAFPVARRILAAQPLKGLVNPLSHRLDNLFDSYVAKRVAVAAPDMVICYENAALETFRAARAAGAVCVLDAASVHFKAQSRWLDEGNRHTSAWINRRKNAEIELADAILTCSPFAAETFRKEGVPAHKVFSVPLGADVPDITGRLKNSASTISFLFVGSIRRLKGVDLLLDVFEELRHRGIAAKLTLIGGATDLNLAKRARDMDNITITTFLHQSDLFVEMVRHDCLVLPSRFDSFGMVVAEAMAMGLPAIVSDRVGAKCIIEENPGSGWIVPLGGHALYSKIRALVQGPEALDIASVAARKAARKYSWMAYRSNVIAILKGIAGRRS